MSQFSEFLTILLLVAVNGFFAGAEVAVLSSRPGNESEKGIGGEALKWLRQHPEKFFATVQICLTILSSLASVYGGAVFIHHLQGIFSRVLDPEISKLLGFVCVVGGLSYLSLIIGELVPKSIGFRHCERLAPLVAIPIYVIARGIHPLVSLVTHSTNLVTRLGAAVLGKVKVARQEPVAAESAEPSEGDVQAPTAYQGPERPRLFVVNAASQAQPAPRHAAPSSPAPQTRPRQRRTHLSLVRVEQSPAS